jgi:general secretion pathway protein E
VIVKSSQAVASDFSRSPAGIQLTVMRSGDKPVRYTLGDQRLIIGRDRDADICIQSKYVSWNHAVVSIEDGVPELVDLASKNCTYVNGSQVSKCVLHDGDVISIGVHRIIVRWASQNVSAAPDDTFIPKPRHQATAKAVRAALASLKNNNRDKQSVDTSPDAFRTFVDNFGSNPDMLAADVETIAIEEEKLDDQANELPVDDMSPDVGLGELVQVVEAAAVAISREDVESAVEESMGEGGNRIANLYGKFADNAGVLTTYLGEIFDYPTLSAAELMKYAPDFDRLGLSDSRERQVALVTIDSVTNVVVADPFDQDLRPWLESRIPDTLRWVLVAPDDLHAFLSRHEQSMRAMDSVVQTHGGDTDGNSEVEDLSFASISQDSSPIVKLVHSTLYDALKAGASDIHMESGNSALEIRYRIDGVLAHVASVKGPDVAEQVISRLKVMSELDIAERRIPQDGRFKSSYEGRPIDFRVSIMPSSFGEDAVLRVLDKQAVTDQLTALSLDSLGFDDSIVASLRKLSERPYGMLLVTGPTGSGKTTTLYGAISETNSGLGKIVTIEDPVEYQLAGVLQIPVNEKKGLTFARGLRSILRHDPDKIMVGEIRDPETAQIAIQSALTGHLVFTTVHANNVFDVLSRFLHMGVDAYSFVSALNGILAQRLLRIVCENCGEDIEPTPAMLAATGQPEEVARAYRWRAGAGCGECRGTGYRGRKAVGELLVLDDELREAIINRAPVRQLKEMAAAGGVQFIRGAALALVRDGLTTIEEVDRVTTMA